MATAHFPPFNTVDNKSLSESYSPKKVNPVFGPDEAVLNKKEEYFLKHVLTDSRAALEAAALKANDTVTKNQQETTKELTKTILLELLGNPNTDPHDINKNIFTARSYANILLTSELFNPPKQS